MNVTAHAIMRYRERVEAIDEDAALAMIMSAAAAVTVAAAFGCDTVIMGNGARLKLKGDTVATVLNKRGRRCPIEISGIQNG